MKALSINQPYASAIVAGIKRVENRTWGSPKLSGMTIAIHATGQVWKPSLLEKSQIRKLWPDCPEPSDLPLGAIIGTAQVRAVVDEDDLLVRDDPWATGPVCWLLLNVVRFRRPTRCQGKQSLWTVPADVEARLNVGRWPLIPRPSCPCGSGETVCCLVSTWKGMLPGCPLCRPRGQSIHT